jgi:cell wall-associated NlpC family hydrolase
MTLDKRLHAFRSDLADMRLRGLVEATDFVVGVEMQISDPIVDIRKEPRPDASVDSQALYGETVLLFEDNEGFGWAQLQTDNYVGYVAMNALKQTLTAPTHVIHAPRTFAYPGADMKFPITKALSMGSYLTIVGDAETRGTRYLKLASGEFVVAHHARAISDHAPDPVSVALDLLGTPYLWGGRSAFGIDCSSLIQLSHAMCGQRLQRDSDMLSQSAGHQIGEGAIHDPLQRGDLVFWKGHVAFMEDAETMLHASGHSMAVVREPYHPALERIKAMYGLPTMYRRIVGVGSNEAKSVKTISVERPIL